MVLNNSDDNYQNQLKKIASEVDSYIVNTSGALDVFRKQIEPIALRWKEYNLALKARGNAISEHWKLVKQKPQLQDKNIKPSNKNWEWDKFYFSELYYLFESNPINEMPAKYAQDVIASIEGYVKRNEAKKQKYAKNSNEYGNLENIITIQKQRLEDINSRFEKLSPVEQKTAWIKTELTKKPNGAYTGFKWFRYLNWPEEAVFGCWRPPLISLPENPTDRLKKPTFEKFYSNKREETTLPPAINEKEQYERYYILLSAVHDNYLPEIEGIAQDIWPDDLAEILKNLSCNIYFGNKIIFFNAAFERIKKEIKPQQVNGLKTVHKNLIKAFSKILTEGKITEITRDTIIRETNYSVGSGNVNSAYKELKEWGIITKDGQDFTSNYQHWKKNPPE